MRVIKPKEYLDLNKEIDAIFLLEEEEYQILLSHKKIFLTIVKITDEELNEMEELGLISGFPKFANQEELAIYGSIIVPSGTLREAVEIIKERNFNEKVIGVLNQLGTPPVPLNYN